MDDYISREEAFDCLTGHVPETVEECISRTIKRIKNLPAADVKPVVRGKWIRGNESATSPVQDSYTCSVCGDKALAGYFGNPVRTNYCPNCGCKMEDIYWEE